jgi:hypothetical protein
MKKEVSKVCNPSPRMIDVGRSPNSSAIPISEARAKKMVLRRTRVNVTRGQGPGYSRLIKMGPTMNDAAITEIHTIKRTSGMNIPKM